MPQIRSRDLRVMIKLHGFERGVVMALETMLDERVQEREHMRELTQLVAQCIDQVGQMVHVGDAMKSRFDEMNRIQQQGNHHGDES